MEDKEVGELWKEWYPERENHKMGAVIICNLIRKLVEERAKIYWGRRVPPRPLPECRQLALRDFGIPEDTWK